MLRFTRCSVVVQMNAVSGYDQIVNALKIRNNYSFISGARAEAIITAATAISLSRDWGIYSNCGIENRLSVEDRHLAFGIVDHCSYMGLAIIREQHTKGGMPYDEILVRAPGNLMLGWV